MTEIPKQLQKDSLRFCFVNYKVPFPSRWQKEENAYKYNDSKLLERIKNGGNYGVIGGYGSIMIVDADSKKILDAFSIFGDTFTIKTGNGWHLFFYVPDLKKSYKLEQETDDSTPAELNFENVGHITSKGRMVVAPGCKHYEQIDKDNFKPTGKTYDIIKDVDIKIITEEHLMAVIKPFLTNKIRGTYEKQEIAKTADNTNAIDIDISLVAKKMSDLQKTSPGYRGHNPDHPQSKSQMDLAIDTNENWWVCGACATNGYGFGNGLYLIALNEGILHCHECKKGGLRGDKFLQVKKLAIEKYGIPKSVFPEFKRPNQEKIQLLKKYDAVQFNEKGVINGVLCPNVAELIINEYPYNFEGIQDKEIMYYAKDAGLFKQDGEFVVRGIVGELLQEKSSEHHKREVVGSIRDRKQTTYASFNPPLMYINMKNGVYDIKTDKILPFSPEYRFINKIPIKYDPEADCPKCKKFFKEVHYEDEIPVIQEMFGYTLYRSYPFHKAFLFHGIGANGKSVEIGLLNALVGEKNSTTQELQSLIENRFATAHLFGKCINTCAEITSDALKMTGKFKKLTGGDLVDGEYKFKGIFEFKNYAKLIFSCNKIPYSKDKSYAFFRRWIILSFPNIFEGKKCNPHLLQEITSDENEMSGLFNWAIKGLKRLLRNGKFSYNKTTTDVMEKYETESDPEYAYCKEFLIGSTGYILKDELYNDYVKWCKKQHTIIQPKNIFSQILQRKVSGLTPDRKRINGRQEQIYFGVSWKKDFEKNNENEQKDEKNNEKDSNPAQQIIEGGA